jgi:hypothetical protein
MEEIEPTAGHTGGLLPTHGVPHTYVIYLRSRPWRVQDI